MFSQSDADDFEFGIAYKGKLLALFENQPDRDYSLDILQEKFDDCAEYMEKIEPEDFE